MVRGEPRGLAGGARLGEIIPKQGEVRDRRTRALSAGRALRAIARNRVHLACIVVNGLSHPTLQYVATWTRARHLGRSWDNGWTDC